jgi:hypothetical protein
MIREFYSAFKFLDKDIEGNFAYYDRFRKAVELLIEEFFKDREEVPEAGMKLLCEAWIQVAYESYEGFAQALNKRDIAVAVGFVGGNTKEGSNTALERLRMKLAEHKAKKQAVKDNREIKTPQRKRKIKDTW